MSGISDWKSEVEPAQVGVLGQLAKIKKDFEASQISDRRVLNLLHANYLYPLSRSIYVATADKTVANTTTETTLLSTSKFGSAQPLTWMWQQGRYFRFALYGIYSTTGTPNLEVKVKFGATTIITTTAAAMPNGMTNRGWELTFDIPVRSLSSNNTQATIVAFAHFKYSNNTGNLQERLMFNATPTTVTINTNTAWDITAQWGTASASNTITCQSAVINI